MKQKIIISLLTLTHVFFMVHPLYGSSTLINNALSLATSVLGNAPLAKTKLRTSVNAGGSTYQAVVTANKSMTQQMTFPAVPSTCASVNVAQCLDMLWIDVHFSQDVIGQVRLSGQSLLLLNQALIAASTANVTTSQIVLYPTVQSFQNGYKTTISIVNNDSVAGLSVIAQDVYYSISDQSSGSVISSTVKPKSYKVNMVAMGQNSKISVPGLALQGQINGLILVPQSGIGSGALQQLPSNNQIAQLSAVPEYGGNPQTAGTLSANSTSSFITSINTAISAGHAVGLQCIPHVTVNNMIYLGAIDFHDGALLGILTVPAGAGTGFVPPANTLFTGATITITFSASSSSVTQANSISLTQSGTNIIILTPPTPTSLTLPASSKGMVGSVTFSTTSVLTQFKSMGALSCFNATSPASVYSSTIANGRNLTSLYVQVSDAAKQKWYQFDCSSLLANVPNYVLHNGLYICLDFETLTGSTGLAASTYQLLVSLRDVAGFVYGTGTYSGMSAQPVWAQVGFNSSQMSSSPAGNATSVLNWRLAAPNCQSVVYQQQSSISPVFGSNS